MTQSDNPDDSDIEYPAAVEGVYTAQKTQIVSLRARIAELERDFAAYRAACDDKTDDLTFENLYMKPMREMKSRVAELESVLADLLHVAQHIRYADWMNEESDLGLQRTRERAREVLGDEK